MKFVTSVLVVLSSLQLSAMQLGNLTLSGNGCFGSTKLVSVNAEEGRYAFPIRAKVNKKKDTNFDRKACNIRLPIAVAANEKIQLTDLSQVVRVVAYKGSDIKTSLAMGLVGKTNPPLNYELKTSEDDSTIVENLKSNGLIAESACGKDTIVTGNLSLIVNGKEAQAFVSTGTALLSIRVVPCTM